MNISGFRFPISDSSDRARSASEGFVEGIIPPSEPIACASGSTETAPAESPALGAPLVEPSHTPYVEGSPAPVGVSAPRLNGMQLVTGAALYGADLFPREADLFAKILRSPHAHAEIVRIDTAPAMDIRGVVGVYTHVDMPGTNRQGLIKRDHPVLVEDRIRFRGDALAVVVATSEMAAIAGRDAIEVECKRLPVIGTIDDALAPDAVKLFPEGNIMGGKRIRRGDADAALAAADIVVSETFQTQTVDHAFLDCEAGVARWDSSVLTIKVPGQWAHEERRLIALALGLPIESVRIICPAVGGAFGGREDLGMQVHVGLAALKHPGKTVALRYDRSESMLARHKRHAIRIHYTIGARIDGTLTAAKVTVYADEGAYASTGPAVLRKAASHATGPYRVPNVSVDVYGVYTNNNPTGAMRGFGACQMAIAYEGMLDRLAAKLGLDRIYVRRLNLIRSGDAVTTGQVLPVVTVHECLDAVLARYRELPPPPPFAVGERARAGGGEGERVREGYGVKTRDMAFPAMQPRVESHATTSSPGSSLITHHSSPGGESQRKSPGGVAAAALPKGLPPHLRRGVGVSTICFGLGYGDGFPDASRAEVRFNREGQLEVLTGGVEYGQGLINMAAQIAAGELGMPLDQTRVIWADTGQTLESGSSSASRQTYFTGNAVKRAASELKEELLDIAGTHLSVHPHEIELEGGFAHTRCGEPRQVAIADLVADGFRRGYELRKREIFKPRTVCEDFETGQSPRAFITYLFGAHLAEVLVDIETGQVRVERYIACHDVGRAINPQSVEGQITGGVTQGIGMALMEEVVMHEGRMLNPNFTDYILPTLRDIPPIECIILETDDPGGPFGARGIGEPPLVGATPAVLSAIADAIGVHPHTTPCTPQRVWELLHPDMAVPPASSRFATAP